MNTSKYPLNPMLRVRQMHEDQAKKEAREAEERLKTANQTLEQHKEDLSRYRLWRPQEEERRYAAIFGKPMSAEGLGTFREGLAKLAEGEIERELKVDEAQKVVQNCEQEAQIAHQAVISARKECLKLEKHREIWQAAEKKEEERLSDLEMEEVRAPVRMFDEGG